MTTVVLFEPTQNCQSYWVLTNITSFYPTGSVYVGETITMPIIEVRELRLENTK